MMPSLLSPTSATEVTQRARILTEDHQTHRLLLEHELARLQIPETRKA